MIQAIASFHAGAPHRRACFSRPTRIWIIPFNENFRFNLYDTECVHICESQSPTVENTERGLPPGKLGTDYSLRGLA